jgi:hypothetical protein
MSLGPRTQELNNLMVQECVSEYMTKMENKHECVRHLAFQASVDSSVSQLSQACDLINQRFTKEDAIDLCTGLNKVHASFWPRFTSGR